jgi:hypothetical protein
MSNNEIIYYNEVYIGNQDIPPIAELPELPEDIPEDVNPVSSIPQSSTSENDNLYNIARISYMPICYFLENTQHYYVCKNMLESDDYIKYTEDYKPKILSYINNLKKIEKNVKQILCWESTSDILSLDNIKQSLEIIISTTIINTILDISNILKDNFNTNEDLVEILKYSHNIEKWYNTLEQLNRTLKIDNIDNLKSYIITLSVLILPLKYAACVISNIDFKINEYFLLKMIDVGNNKRNLMILSLFNGEIRKKIIEKISPTAYTNYLLKKIKIFDNFYSYIDILLLTGKIIDIFDDLDLDVFNNINFFDNNNIFHLLILSLSLINKPSEKKDIIMSLTNNKDFITKIYNFAFIKNNFEMIPMEFSNYDYYITHLLRSIYLKNPIESLKKLTFDTIGLTHSILDELINQISDNDILDNISNIIEIYDKEFKYTIKYTRSRYIRSIEQRERTYITIKRIINVCINNNIHSDIFINLTPFISDEHIQGYIDYIKMTYEKLDLYIQNKTYDLDTTNISNIGEVYDNIFNKAYKIWQNIEFLHYYNFNGIIEINKDDVYLQTIINYKSLIKVLETRIIQTSEYVFIYNFMKLLLSTHGYKQNIITLLFLLEKNVILDTKYDEIFKNINYELLYIDIISYLEKKITLNKDLFDYVIINFIKYIKSAEEFKLLIHEATNKELLYTSELPLEIKFGRNMIDIYYHFTHYYNINFILPQTQDYEQYKYKYGKVITSVIMDYANNQSFILEDIIKTFKIDITFINKFKLREKFIDMHKFFSQYNSYNFIYWYDTFVKMIKFTSEYFTDNNCNIIFDNKLNYNTKRIWIKYGYLTSEYILNYVDYINIFAGQIMSSNDFKNFIKLNVIKFKDFTTKINLTKLLTRNNDLEFIFTQNQDLHENSHNYMKILKESIKLNENFILELIANNHIKMYLLSLLTFNILLTKNILTHKIKNKILYDYVLEYIKDKYKTNDELLLKICNTEQYKDLQILNLSLKYIFTNYLLDYDTIKEIFEKSKLNEYSIFSYINSFNNITYINTIKNLIKLLTVELANNILPITLIINSNKIFLEKTPEYTIEEKIFLLYTNKIFIKRKVLLELINSINNRNECNINTLINLIKVYRENNFIILLCEIHNLLILYPELIYIFNLNETMNYIDQVIKNCIDNNDTFYCFINYIHLNNIQLDINFKKIILEKIYNIDKNYYVEALVIFNKNTDFDIDATSEIINILNNYELLNRILVKNYINPEIICYLKNSLERYTISDCSPDIISIYIDLYTYDDLIKVDKTNKPNIFSFYKDSKIIEYLLNKFKHTNILELKDNYNQNVYTYCIKLNLPDLLPTNLQISKETFIYLCKEKIDSNIIFNLIEKQSEILDDVDDNYTSIIYYLMVYQDNLFKEIYNNDFITDFNKININNETLIMSLIKLNNTNTNDLLLWLIKKNIIKLCNTYGEINSGSILTYCLKYNKELFNCFVNIPEVFDKCQNITDNVNNIINPYNPTFINNNINLDLLQIAILYSQEALNILLKKYSNKFIKNSLNKIINLDSINFNIFYLCMLNNPINIETLLMNDNCDEKYLLETFNLFNNIEDILEIQPAAYYYLLKSNKILSNNILWNKMKLNLDEHYYGFNYKFKLLLENINNVKHYVRGTQKIDNNVKCNICEIFYPNVLFLDCKHKTCIICALKSKKCQFCRGDISDDKKILLE